MLQYFWYLCLQCNIFSRIQSLCANLSFEIGNKQALYVWFQIQLVKDSSFSNLAKPHRNQKYSAHNGKYYHKHSVEDLWKHITIDIKGVILTIMKYSTFFPAGWKLRSFLHCCVYPEKTKVTNCVNNLA